MPDAKTPTEEQPIEVLQQRYEKLNTKKIQAETQHTTAEKRLNELKASAREKYGTDDLAALQKKLDDLIAENARKRSEYQTELDRIEADLADVEKKFADATTPAPNRR